MEFIVQNWEQAYNDTLHLYEMMKISNCNPDVIIGIARGGWIPARLLADFYSMKNLANIKVEAYSIMGEEEVKPKITQGLNINIRDKNILIVDDVADSGKSLKVILDALVDKRAKSIKTATLFYKTRSIVIPDYYVKKTDAWVVFPWEIFETTEELIPKFIQEGLTLEESKLKLKEIGLPFGMVESYFNLKDKFKNK